jgi:hypothetical protein
MPGFDRTIFMNSNLIAKIQKNKLEEIHVSVLKNNMIDFRIHFFFPNDPEPKPTKKGVWLSFKNTPKIISAFEGFLKDSSKDFALEFEKTKPDEQLRVYSSEFKGAKLIHIRTFYKKDGGFQPGRGVSITPEILGQVVDALKKAESVKES